MALPLSKKILSVKPSPTVALNAKAQQMAKQGHDVISFAVGEPHFNTPKSVVETAIDSLKRGRTKYGPAGGGLELRTLISEKLKRENRLDFLPDQVVLGIGAKEILFHLMLSLLNDGDEVLMLAPYWVSYADQVIAAGGVPVIVPLPPQFPKTPIDLKHLDQYVTPKTVALLINSPNNPAGYVLSQEDLLSLGAYLKDKPWWIVSDEIYEYLDFERPHFSLLEFVPELRDRFILVNGFSKGFSMTGWRVGYAAGPASVIKLVRSLQSHSSTCLPGFIEDACCVAIAAGRSLVQTELKELGRLRLVTQARLAQIKGLEFGVPEGAFYFFLDLRPWCEKGPKSTMEICEFLLNDVSIALVPGEAFGAPGFIRLSYALQEARLLEGLDRLEKALARL